MTLKLDGGNGFFLINDDSFPSGQYRIVRIDTEIGLTERGNLKIVEPTDFTVWRDSADASYASVDDLLTDLRSKIFA